MENLEQFNLSVLSDDDLCLIDGGMKIRIGNIVIEVPDGTPVTVTKLPKK